MSNLRITLMSTQHKATSITRVPSTIVVGVIVVRVIVVGVMGLGQMHFLTASGQLIRIRSVHGGT